MSFKQSDGTTFEQLFVQDNIIVDRWIGGNLFGMGDNGNGQLGSGNTTTVSSPVQVSSSTDWAQVVYGTNTAAGIKTDGTLWTWGSDGYGQTGRNPVGGNSSPIQVGVLTNWKQVAVGRMSMHAVKTDGTLWTWGRNTYGQLGLGNAGATARSSPTQVGALTNWKQVACGYQNMFALQYDGTLWSCGYNDFGELGLGDSGSSARRSSPTLISATGWKYVTASTYSTAGIKTDGTLWTWGRNQNGQLAQGDTTNRSTPTQVPSSLTNWKYITAEGSGASTCFAGIRSDGTLWTWGGSGSGQLGLGDNGPRSSPTQVPGLWKTISMSSNAAGIKTDGTLWTWGAGTNGASGQGDIINRSSPVQLSSATNWKQVSASNFTTIALTSSEEFL